MINLTALNIHLKKKTNFDQMDDFYLRLLLFFAQKTAPKKRERRKGTNLFSILLLSQFQALF